MSKADSQSNATKRGEKERTEMAKADSILGLFADEPDLIDEITRKAMQSRENQTGSGLKMIENLKTL